MMVYLLSLFPEDAKNVIGSIVAKISGVPASDSGYYVILYGLTVTFLVFVSLGVYEFLRWLKRRRARDRPWSEGIGHF